MEKGETSRSHEIDEKGLHEELVSSDRSGKPVELSEDIRVMHAHDGTGQPVESSSSSTHIVKEQFVPEENRDIASFNADIEFNRAIDEENIDFNIPGVPHSAVKRSHGVNVQNLIQKIENHPHRQAYMSPRPSPKISLRHDWTKELGSEVARQPRGEVSRQAKSFQPAQPIPKPICDRSGQPDIKHEVFVDKGETSWCREIKEKSSPWSGEIKEKSSHEELCSSDRSGQPDITPSVIKAHNLPENIRVEQTHDRSGQPDKRETALRAAPEVHRENALLNTDNEFNRAIDEEVIAFNIPGLPHSTVKQLHSASVGELIQKIENHPHRHVLQRDLQQSQSFNPFSQESKEMIHEVGNIELCGLLIRNPVQSANLSYWDVGIVCCTCGHFWRTRTEDNKKFVQYTMDLLSIPNDYTKDDPMGTVTGRSQGTESTTSPIRSRRSAKSTTNWVSTTDSYETKSSART